MIHTTHQRALCLAAIAAATIISGCAYTPVREHPDFASAARKVNTIAILPPDVEFTRIVFTGDNERMPEREREIAENLLQSVETSLKDKRYALRPPFTQRVAESNKNMSFELEQLRAAYTQAAKQLYERAATEDEAKKYRVSVGPVVNPIASLMEADALFYVRYAGAEKSGGQQAKDIFAGALLGVLTGVIVVPASEVASLEAALIDGTTGDILWANRGAGHTLQAGSMQLSERLMAQLPDKDRAAGDRGSAVSQTSAAATKAP